MELTGGRQRGLVLDQEAGLSFAQYTAPVARTPRRIVVSEAQKEAHAGFVGKIKDAIWTRPDKTD